MAKTTGVILAIGGITLTNRVLFQDQKMDWRIPIGTALAAVLFAGAEKAWTEGAVLLSWTALATITFTRTDADVPSPAESALTWWDKTKKPVAEGKTPRTSSSTSTGSAVQI